MLRKTIFQRGLDCFLKDYEHGTNHLYHFFLNKLFFNNFQVFEELSDIHDEPIQYIIGIKGNPNTKKDPVLLVSKIMNFPVNMGHLKNSFSQGDFFFNNKLVCPGVHSGIVDTLIKLSVLDEISDITLKTLLIFVIEFRGTLWASPIELLKTKYGLNFKHCILHAPTGGKIVKKSPGMGVLRFLISPKKQDWSTKLFKSFFRISHNDEKPSYIINKNNLIFKFFSFFDERSLWNKVHFFEFKAGNNPFISPFSVEAKISSDKNHFKGVLKGVKRFLPNRIGYPVTEQIKLFWSIVKALKLKTDGISPKKVFSSENSIDSLSTFLFKDKNDFLDLENKIMKTVEKITSQSSDFNVDFSVVVGRAPFKLSEKTEKIVLEKTGKLANLHDFPFPTDGAYTETENTVIIGIEENSNMFDPDKQFIEVDSIEKMMKFYKHLLLNFLK